MVAYVPYRVWAHITGTMNYLTRASRISLYCGWSLGRCAGMVCIILWYGSVVGSSLYAVSVSSLVYLLWYHLLVVLDDGSWMYAWLLVSPILISNNISSLSSIINL